MAETTEVIEIKPQAGPQEGFLSNDADIVIFGGAAGAGKTYGLLLEPLRHINNPAFGCVTFRRTYKQITNEGGMWDESGNLYPLLGATPNQNDLAWTFPEGARHSFAHMQHEVSKYIYKGAQITLINWDQLEDFTEGQFFYMLSRNRSTCGVKPYMRATCNAEPGWLADFLAWWIDQETGYAIPERGGQTRYFIRVRGEVKWADRPEELTRIYGDNQEVSPKSVTFIPADIYDNPILLEKDPGYLGNLLALDLIDQERLLKGNWKIKPESGKVFNRGWFEIVDAVPAGGVEVRYWDFASTDKELSKSDPDYSAGVKMRLVEGVYYVTDCIAEQKGPAEVEKMFRNIALQDEAEAKRSGSQYRLRWEVEPGSAAKRDSRRLAEMIAGLDGIGRTVRGDKLTRAKAFAAQAYAGNVKLLKGAWNTAWLNHMHNQPDEPHDDIMDASSGAFNDLARPEQPKARSMQG
jgi:predicted phage terminase large subunit-like protein